VASLDGLSGQAMSDRLDELASRVIVPYTAMSIALVVLGVLVRMSPLPDITPEAEGQGGKEADHSHILSYPYLVFGVIALFLYVGVEVVAGDTIGLYGRLQGVPLATARHLTSYTLAAMVVGYLVGIAAIPRYIGQQQALTTSAVLGVVLSLLALFLDGLASVLCIALLGLANALVWPAIWPLAIQGLGRHTRTGSAMLIMAMSGGALLPLLYGRLSDVPAIGAQQAYWLLIPCYLFILWYGWRGHRIRAW
jgi:glucose/galactose transporter